MSSSISSSCNPSSAATRPNALPRASRVITRRNSCSAPPPWRRGAKTTISTSENDPASGLPVPAGAALLRPEPDRNSHLCPRLPPFREAARVREPNWFNSPAPSFGDPKGRLLIVGLAPGLQGANRTGRPFTGDFAGDLLYATLIEYGFAKGVFAARPDDGLALVDARITNAVRCVPPENKPVGAEIANSRDSPKR